MLKPFFTYYGGKYRIAPKYPCPIYDTIVEAFAGSAGYALHYPDRKIILNDIDPVICGLWEYLISVSEKEILELPLNIDHVDNFNVAKEAKHLIGFWLNKGAVSPRLSPSSWARSGIRPNSHWGEVIRYRIASQLNAIRHWKVSNISFDNLENYKASWFIDPPYCSKAGRLYRFSDIDYKLLSDWSKNRMGQVIVCESSGASWLPFVPFFVSKVSESKHGGKTLTECIYHKVNDREDKPRIPVKIGKIKIKLKQAI